MPPQDLTKAAIADYLNISENAVDKLLQTEKITQKADLDKLKTHWETESLKARKKLATLTQKYNMGY